MNNRIFELANQVLPREDHLIEGDPKVYAYFFSSQELVQFAELIIKEYEKLLPENCSWNGPADSPMKGWHVAFVARKHFGVE
jgi:hypothetical protein